MCPHWRAPVSGRRPRTARAREVEAARRRLRRVAEAEAGEA
ncbi:hypothetical protein SAMN04488066_13014 [Halorubrum aquaticum]|uniref:Uncharacterized protein n=1 Tax=Halorubrum aquaticum TaxID=387340 RepID=A0A1I3CUF5_9EURY|nr:hypothetical protein SAMN04488066_13014 [Halorubrum aquaticum]